MRERASVSCGGVGGGGVKKKDRFFGGGGGSKNKTPNLYQSVGEVNCLQYLRKTSYLYIAVFVPLTGVKNLDL